MASAWLQRCGCPPPSPQRQRTHMARTHDAAPASCAAPGRAPRPGSLSSVGWDGHEPPVRQPTKWRGTPRLNGNALLPVRGATQRGARSIRTHTRAGIGIGSTTANRDLAVPVTAGVPPGLITRLTAASVCTQAELGGEQREAAAVQRRGEQRPSAVACGDDCGMAPHVRGLSHLPGDVQLLGSQDVVILVHALISLTKCAHFPPFWADFIRFWCSSVPRLHSRQPGVAQCGLFAPRASAHSAHALLE